MKPSLVALVAFKQLNRDTIRLFRRFCFLLYYYQCKSSFVFAPSDELYRDILFCFLEVAKKPGNRVTTDVREYCGDIQYNYYYSTAEWLWDEWEDLTVDYMNLEPSCPRNDRKLKDLKSLDVHDLKVTTDFLNDWLYCLVREYFQEKDYKKTNKILGMIVE